MRGTGRRFGCCCRTAAAAGRKVFIVAMLVTAPAGPAGALTADWGTSNLDSFFYSNAAGPGQRALGPSFANAFYADEQSGEFLPHSASDPARLGMALIAFDTSLHVESGLPANRYQVNSVRATITFTLDGDTSTLIYDNSPDSRVEVLSVEEGDAGRPMELYGVGFRGDYNGYEFSNSTIGPPLFDEQTHPASGTAGAYVAYPIVGDESEPGTYRDVTNSITGGDSATHGTTGPFDPTPWAIGTAELSPGDGIPDDTTFTFELILELAGVREYVQQSLADGALGLFVSSLHETGEFGAGGGYPRWYFREAVGFPYFASTVPTLSIDYQILSESLPGDYDGNGKVEAADYDKWVMDFGMAVASGTGADGSGNGGVDAADYTVWRDHLMGMSLGAGTTSLRAGSSSSPAVPEPASIWLLIWATAILSPFARYNSFPRSAWERTSLPPLRRCGRRGAPRHCVPTQSAGTRGWNGAVRGRENRAQLGFTLVELLVSIAIIGILVSLLLPAIQSARESARRVTCQNNLRQIGQATHNFAHANGHLPPPKVLVPGSVVNSSAATQTSGSTFVALLPYLEDGARYAQYDREKSVLEEPNVELTSQALDVYLCPSMLVPRAVPQPACGEELGPGSYMISAGTDITTPGATLDGAFSNPKTKSLGGGKGVVDSYTLGFKNITDGTSKTFLVGENDYGLEEYTWDSCGDLTGSPKYGDQTWAHGYWHYAWAHINWRIYDLTKRRFYNRSKILADELPIATKIFRVYRSDHPGGSQFVFVDGSVHFVPETIDYPVLYALVTRAGGEAEHRFD